MLAIVREPEIFGLYRGFLTCYCNSKKAADAVSAVICSPDGVLAFVKFLLLLVTLGLINAIFVGKVDIYRVCLVVKGTLTRG